MIDAGDKLCKVNIFRANQLSKKTKLLLKAKAKRGFMGNAEKKASPKKAANGGNKDSSKGSEAEGPSSKGKTKESGSQETSSEAAPKRNRVQNQYLPKGYRGGEYKPQEPSGEQSSIYGKRAPKVSPYNINSPNYKPRTPAEKKYWSGTGTKKAAAKAPTRSRRLKTVNRNSIDDLVLERTYEQIRDEYSAAKDAAPKATYGEKVKGFIRNMKNITVNGYDNTVGYMIAKRQNEETRQAIKDNPEGKEKVVYLMHGMLQNQGSQHRLAAKLKEKGYLPYHLKGYHHLPLKEKVKKINEQIEELYHDPDTLRGKGTKPVQIAPYREAIWSGHSSGADTGIYYAQTNNVNKYNIKQIQARAPVPSGIGDKPLTMGQKMIMMLASGDDVRSKKGKAQAVQMHQGVPKVPVYVFAGKYDQLATPDATLYKHAAKHYIIDHPDSSHFGTSGVNDTMNEVFAENIEKGATNEFQDYHDRKRKQIQERTRKIA